MCYFVSPNVGVLMVTIQDLRDAGSRRYMEVWFQRRQNISISFQCQNRKRYFGGTCSVNTCSYILGYTWLLQLQRPGWSSELLSYNYMSLRLIHIARLPKVAGIDRYTRVKIKNTFDSLIEYRTITLIVHEEALPEKKSLASPTMSL